MSTMTRCDDLAEQADRLRTRRLLAGASSRPRRWCTAVGAGGAAPPRAGAGRAGGRGRVAGVLGGGGGGRLAGAAGPVRGAAVPPGRGGPGGHSGLDRGGPPPLGQRQAAPVLGWSPLLNSGADLSTGR